MQSVVAHVENFLAEVAVRSNKHPVATLLLLCAVTAGALFAARNLTLEADLAELLPDSFESVQDLDVLQERFGGVGYVVVVARGQDPNELIRFADDIAPRLEAVPQVRYVDYTRPYGFFRDRALYFLEKEDLEFVRDRFQARETYERLHRNPMFIDLEGEPPPSLDFSELIDKYKGHSDNQWMSRQGSESYYLDRDKGMLILLIKPKSLSTDLSFAGKFVGQIQRVVDDFAPQAYPGLDVQLTGRYKKRVDQQTLLQRDLKLASSLAIALVLLYLALHFRRLLAVVLIFTPLIAGLSWTYGMAGIVFGSLNILTAFIGAILLGLGIDHGIHLLGRYEAEFSHDRSPSDMLRLTFGETGRAVTIAGLTTTVGFLGVSVSEFRAFREFGIIAAGGMILVVAAYATCLPALLGLATRFGWHPRRRTDHGRQGIGQYVPRLSAPILGLTLVGLIAAALLLPRGEFDYDFNALQSSDIPSFKLDLETNDLLGYSQTPVVVLTDDEADEPMVAEALRERSAALDRPSAIDFFASVSDLVPADQEAKKPLLEDIGAVLDKVRPSWLEEDQRDQLDTLKTMARAQPFTRDDIPKEIRQQFEPREGQDRGGFVLVFPSVDLSDGQRVADLADEVRAVPLPGGKRISAAGEAMILADILKMVSREAVPVLTLTLVVIMLTLRLLLGAWRSTLLCLAPALVTLLLTLGLLPLLPVQLNYLNIVMIPVLFGIGVDGSVHLVTRLESGEPLLEVLSDTGRAIAGAILTTGLGFGAMMVADHPGLNSLGALAILGLAFNVIACLLSLPALLSRTGWGRMTTQRQADSYA